MSIIRIEIIEYNKKPSNKSKKRKYNIIKNCPTYKKNINIEKRIKLANKLFYHKTYCDCGNQTHQ